MAMGMDMLLKSMGFDPDEVKQQFDTARAQVDARVLKLEAQLGRIEAAQQEILRQLELSEERAARV